MWFEEKHNLIHSQPDQQKRQLAATKIPIVCFDKEKQSAIINNYAVTLNRCTCRDYQMRELPCKHIYRLAYELGYMKPPVNIIEDKNYIGSHNKQQKNEVTKQLKLIIDELPIQAQLLLLGYLTQYVIQPENEAAEKILSILEEKGLLIKSIPPEPSVEQLCNGYTIKELKTICGEISSKYSKRADIINYISERPEIINKLQQEYDITFNNNGFQYASHIWPKDFAQCKHSIIRYLRAKSYSTNDFIDVRVPEEVLYFK